nr:unnamed protein product [Spirometra erinaceieuropaei]
MHSNSRVSATTVHEHHFVDDCALNATAEGNTQRSMDLFAADRENFDLIINTEKTVVVHQRPPAAAYVAPQINVNGAQLSAVDNFTHLDSALSRSTKSMIRISKATQIFGPL